MTSIYYISISLNNYSGLIEIQSFSIPSQIFFIIFISAATLTHLHQRLQLFHRPLYLSTNADALKWNKTCHRSKALKSARESSNYFVHLKKTSKTTTFQVLHIRRAHLHGFLADGGEGYSYVWTLRDVRSTCFLQARSSGNSRAAVMNPCYLQKVKFKRWNPRVAGKSVCTRLKPTLDKLRLLLGENKKCSFTGTESFYQSS